MFSHQRRMDRKEYFNPGVDVLFAYQTTCMGVLVLSVKVYHANIMTTLEIGVLHQIQVYCL